jgi:hypothetical protein
MKYEIQLMLQHGGGAIVNNASIAGMIADPVNHRRLPFPFFRSRRSKVQYQTKWELYKVHVNLKRRRKYEFTTFPVITA